MVRSDLEKLEPQFLMAIPSGTGLNPRRLARLAMTTLSGPQGEKILACTRESVLGSLMMAAQLGLEIGTPLGQASLVPYKRKGVDTCQLIVEYRGMIDLARRSGRVGAVDAVVVHENDEFEYERGLHPKLVHVPHRGEDAGEPVAVYAVCRFTDGSEPQFDVMLAHEVEAVRKSSRSAGFDDSPWNGPFKEEMWRKTMIRRAFKLWPVGTAARVAARHQEMLDAGLEPEPVPEGPIVAAAGEDVAAGAEPAPRRVQAPPPKGRKQPGKMIDAEAAGAPPDDPEAEVRGGLVARLTKIKRADPEAYSFGVGLSREERDEETGESKGWDWDPKKVKGHDLTKLTVDQLQLACDRAEEFVKKAGPVGPGGDDEGRAE
jgi:recombination protein RecT